MDLEDYQVALDRIHTAIHACVKRLAQEVGIDVSAKKGLQEQFAEIRGIISVSNQVLETAMRISC